MKIVHERTRIIFSEYNDLEKHKIDNLVATMDKVFSHEDEDKKKIYLPTGMLKSIQQSFPNDRIEDLSSTYWNYANIQPIQHKAEPRNQLQVDFIKFGLEAATKKQKFAGILSPGTGKALPIHVKIPTPTGYTRMGDLQLGDRVIGSDGKPTIVEEIHDQIGLRDVYKITFNDGRTALCDGDHLWSVFYSWTSTQRTISTKEMLKDYKIYRPHKKSDGSNRDPYDYRYRIPILSSPVEYDSQPISLDPYVVGALIGDGCLREYALTVSSEDGFVPGEIARIMGYQARKSCNANHSYLFYDRSNGLKRVAKHNVLQDLPEIYGSYSRDKLIPEEYLYNSYEIRMELLRGLMDTDGSITYAEGRYHVRYNSSSKGLLLQVKELLQGLGFNGTIGRDKREEKYVNGYHGTLLFQVPHAFKRELFRHPKKLYQANKCASLPSIHRTAEYLTIKDIQLVKRDKTRCIKVSAPDHLFLTENFIVTHNTFMACYMAIKIGVRTLIAVPTSGIKKQWVETLIKMFKVPEERVLSVDSPQSFVNVKTDFVVVSHASLAVLNKKYDLEAIMKTNMFGLKVIDEVQMWFHNIIKIDGSSNICHNLYLTGTFGRSGDEENVLYQTMFGDLAIFREKDKKATIFDRKPGNVYGMRPHMNVKMVWAKSDLSDADIKKVTGSMRYSERAGKWMRYGISIPAYTKLIIPPDGRMTKFLSTILRVIKSAEEEVTYGKTLILSATINSTEIIAAHLRRIYPNKKIATIHSHNSKMHNDQAKLEADIMISTVKSSGTGFDVKDLSKLIVAEQFKSWILADQVSGRLRRRDDGKDTYMWDIVDATIPQLRAWANTRADILKRKSKLFKVIDV